MTRPTPALLVCAAALAACAVGEDSTLNAASDGVSCPDPRSIYASFFSVKPDCWTDEEWELYQSLIREEAQGRIPR